MRKNERPVVTQAAYEPGEMCYLGKDIAGILLNEPIVSQNWSPDCPTDLCGLIDSNRPS